MQPCDENETFIDDQQSSKEVSSKEACALFDFALYTIVGGLLCAFGIIGNALSFLVLQFKDNSKSSTTFFLRAMAVTLGLGITFLLMQGADYFLLGSEGLTLSSGVFGTQ